MAREEEAVNDRELCELFGTTLVILPAVRRAGERDYRRERYVQTDLEPSSRARRPGTKIAEATGARYRCWAIDVGA